MFIPIWVLFLVIPIIIGIIAEAVKEDLKNEEAEESYGEWN